MTNVDEEFIKDLGQCLQIASQLSELGTEESKTFVSEQLNNLHTFLQKKQHDAECRIEEEMKKEENEIEQLKKRIERATASDGESESDIAYTDFNILWSQLKDENWQLVFNAFISETKDKVEEILKNLINILMTIFSKCKEKASQNRTDMKFQVYFPGDDPTNKNLKLPKEQDHHLEGLCRRCQLRSTPFTITSIRKAIVSDVRLMNPVSKHLKYKSKKLSNEIEKYVEKCVEVCWIACLEEPEIQFITKPKTECPNIATDFIGLDRTIYTARVGAAIVEWPAVVQGNKVRIQWHLYPTNQPRPEPKDIRGDQSVDYRVAGIEGSDGKIKDDPDDKVKEEDNASSFQSDSGRENTDEKSGNSKDRSKETQDSMRKTTEDKEVSNKIKYKEKPKGHKNTQF